MSYFTSTFGGSFNEEDWEGKQEGDRKLRGGKKINRKSGTMEKREGKEMGRGHLNERMGTR